LPFDTAVWRQVCAAGRLTTTFRSDILPTLTSNGKGLPILRQRAALLSGPQSGPPTKWLQYSCRPSHCAVEPSAGVTNLDCFGLSASNGVMTMCFQFQPHSPCQKRCIFSFRREPHPASPFHHSQRQMPLNHKKKKETKNNNHANMSTSNTDTVPSPDEKFEKIITRNSVASIASESPSPF
jgi:hypothetical protein